MLFSSNNTDKVLYLLCVFANTILYSKMVALVVLILIFHEKDVCFDNNKTQ